MHLKHQKIHNHHNILCGPISYKEGLLDENAEDYRATLLSIHGAFSSLHLRSSSSADAVRLPGFPIHLQNYCFHHTLGYCNGIICMQICNFLDEECSKSKRILIGNPSTGDYRILPEPTSFPLLVGFGCDSSLDDYKCVLIDNITRNPHIFSLKLNSWRTNLGSSDNFTIKPQGSSYINVGVALDRSIYWLVEKSNIIVEFDFKDDVFRQFPLPPTVMPDVPSSMRVIGGSLCIINGIKGMEIWCMSKQEEKSNNEKTSCCWSKTRLTLSPTNLVSSRIYPLSFTKDQKVLCCTVECVEVNSFVLINPKTETVEDFSIRDETGNDGFEQYSFIPPPHTAYVETLFFT